MEALVAVGLAGNIVQFVDFAWQLVTAANTLFNSARGTTKNNEQVELLTRNLRQLVESKNLRALAEKTQYDDVQHSRQDAVNLRSLGSLSRLCVEVADELIALLDTLKINGEHRGIESVYRALRTIWKKDDLERLERRLTRISNVLNNEIRQRQQDRISRQLNMLTEGNTRLESTRDDEINNLKRLVRETFQEISKSFEEIKEGLRREEDHSSLTRVHQAWLQLPFALERGQELRFEQYILQELRYLNIDNRLFAIPAEHAQTFQWIFAESYLNSDSPANFVEWLQSNSDLFWITGKPGSGKSTLMKFIAAHQDVSRHLKNSEWLGSSELVIASYYFWSAAKDSLQKSQAGLLRSILYQILRQCPDLISAAFPTCRVTFDEGLPPPDTFREVSHLLGALKRVSEAVPNHHIKFCFFIDGLDEYDGKPATVIDLVELLRNFPNIKMCVSSRPWNEFQSRFGTGKWKLSIHELTKKDIRTYVEDTLGADPIFTNLRDSDQRYPDLVRTIISSADGVFLWVVLVVRSLLEGLTNADRIIDLQKRLEEIPTDLEAFFERILITIDDRYRQDMAVDFIISLEAFSNLPLLSHWFCDEHDDNPKYAFQLQTRGLSEMEIESKVQQSLTRINARCKGLLEKRVVSDNTKSFAVRAFTWQVDFLHRTVRDFLALDSMQIRLKTWSAGRSAVDSKICCSILAMVKSVPSLVASQHAPELMETFFHHAKRLQKYDTDSRFSQRLPRELQKSLRTRGIFDYQLWTKNLDMYKAEALNRIDETLNVSEMDAGFFFTCAAARLVAYISNVLQRHPNLVDLTGSKLLLEGLTLARGLDGEYNLEFSSEKIDITILLLQNGVDPNKPDTFNVKRNPMTNNLNVRRPLSIWELYLTELRDIGSKPALRDQLHSSSAFLCCKALLQHGADPCTKIRPHSRTPGHTVTNQPAYSLLKDIFTQDQYLILQEVFHPRNDEDAAVIQKFLNEANLDNEVERRLSITSEDSDDHVNGELVESQQPKMTNSYQSESSLPPNQTESTQSTSRKGFLATMRKIRGRLKT